MTWLLLLLGHLRAPRNPFAISERAEAARAQLRHNAWGGQR